MKPDQDVIPEEKASQLEEETLEHNKINQNDNLESSQNNTFANIDENNNEKNGNRNEELTNENPEKEVEKIEGDVEKDEDEVEKPGDEVENAENNLENEEVVNDDKSTKDLQNSEENNLDDTKLEENIDNTKKPETNDKKPEVPIEEKKVSYIKIIIKILGTKPKKHTKAKY